jgi:hypothetical protein
VFGKKDIAINGVTMVQGRGEARRQTQSNRANHKYGRIVARRIVAPRPLPLIDPPARLTAAKQSAGGFICWQETPIPRLSHPRCWRSSILSPPPPPETDQSPAFRRDSPSRDRSASRETLVADEDVAERGCPLFRDASSDDLDPA